MTTIRETQAVARYLSEKFYEPHVGANNTARAVRDFARAVSNTPHGVLDAEVIYEPRALSGLRGVNVLARRGDAVCVIAIVPAQACYDANSAGPQVAVTRRITRREVLRNLPDILSWFADSSRVKEALIAYMKAHRTELAGSFAESWRR